MEREKRDIFRIVVLLAFVSLFFLSTMPCALSPISFTVPGLGGSREPSAPISVGGAPYPGLWLSGDAHMHTNFSDGWPRTVEDRAREATENDLDFIIITDHTYYYLNTREELYNYYNTIKNVDSAYPDVKVIPGFEVTTEYVDMLAYGLTADDFEPYMTAWLTPQEFATAIQDAGGVAYMAHPFGGDELWKYGADGWMENLTGFEGLNGGSILSNYIVPAGVWDQTLKAGKRYFAIGNTDAHGDIAGGVAKREAGESVATFVYCPNATEEGIVEGYRRGCIYFSHSIPVGSDYRPLFRMEFTVNDTWMGQTLTVPTAESTLRLWINVTIAEGNTTIDSVSIVQDGKLAQRIWGGGSTNVTQYLNFLDLTYTTDSYFRIYARDTQDRCVVSNPIFLKRTYIKKVPAEYPTIQGAINAANPRDIIIVSPRTYYEHVVVNKTVTLIGEDPTITIIDGNDSSILVDVNAKNVSISGFTIQDGDYGIRGANISSLTIVGNNVRSNNKQGIYLYNSTGNNITCNTITMNRLSGILLIMHSSGNDITSNTITSNSGEGVQLRMWSTDNNIIDNTITNNSHGIELYLSDSNTIKSNTLSNNSLISGSTGVLLQQSNSNTISGNTASNNDYGIFVLNSSDNTIIHNNFINNKIQNCGKIGEEYVNAWDNGAEGNYWSDYNGTDTDQDGIGDTPYKIDENNQDNHPLMGMFSDFTVTFEGTDYHVTTICNSTITNFQFNQLQKIMSFKVSGSDGTVGFCRICIPHDLLNGPYTVLVDGSPPILLKELPASNATHTHLYFTYIHTTHRVTIVPEFPSALVLLLFIIVTLVTVIAGKKMREKLN